MIGSRQDAPQETEQTPNNAPKARFRKILARPGITPLPGAYDALTARIIERVGFQAAYATGSGISAAALGLPDLGLSTMTEMLQNVRAIVNAVQIPILADADTGYGDVINVRRTVEAFENSGVAGIHLEDQAWPKRCGHFEGKRLIEPDAMLGKINSALAARKDPDFLLIARTDALAVEGFERTIERARTYSSTGVDAIFIDAPSTIEQIEEIPNRINKPLIINVDFSRKTPWLSLDELEKLGYRIAIYPGVPQLSSLYAATYSLTELKETGTISSREEGYQAFEQLQKFTDLSEWIDWQEGFEA